MAKLKNQETVADTEVQLKKEGGSHLESKEQTGGSFGEVEQKDTVSIIAETKPIPEHVDKVLRMFPNYKELAVDASGGVYTDDSQCFAKGEVVLYENPYYKQ